MILSASRSCSTAQLNSPRRAVSIGRFSASIATSARDRSRLLPSVGSACLMRSMTEEPNTAVGASEIRSSTDPSNPSVLEQVSRNLETTKCATCFLLMRRTDSSAV